MLQTKLCYLSPALEVRLQLQGWAAFGDWDCERQLASVCSKGRDSRQAELLPTVSIDVYEAGPRFPKDQIGWRIAPASKNYDIINAQCSEKPVCVHLSWQPGLTKTSAFHESLLLRFLALGNQTIHPTEGSSAGLPQDTEPHFLLVDTSLSKSSVPPAHLSLCNQKGGL